jgi:hypothetical protein
MSQQPGKVTPLQPSSQPCKEEEGPPLSDERYRPSSIRYFTIHTFASYTVIKYIYIYIYISANTFLIFLLRPSLLKKGKNNFFSKLDSANTFLIFLLNPNSNPTFLLILFQSQFFKVTRNCVNKQLKTLFRKKKYIKRVGLIMRKPLQTLWPYLKSSA